MTQALHKTLISLAAALAVAGGAAGEVRAQPFQDMLVQPPNLAPPQRGSLAGTLSRLSFGPGDLARGTFKLPLPIDAPGDRGPLLAGVVPAYSAESGITEWGMGWEADLAIRRFRPLGEIDFATDGFTSPWGRLAAGDDGFYPAGLTSVVRVVQVAGGWIAQAGDGTRYTFGANDAVTTPHGTFQWMLSRVDNVLGDSTTLSWSRNASGRPFLASVQWGGRNDGTQYRMTFDHEAVPRPFVSYVSGDRRVLDQRISTITVGVKQGAGYATRWTYRLAYQASPTGPAFYLHSLTKTYASGESEPAVVYDYDLGDELRAAAQFASIPALEGFLAQNGGLALQPDQAAMTDLEQDGLVDLETAFDQTALHQTQAGFVAESLPPAPGADPACRPPASLFNRPRTLARMHGDAAAPQVVWVENGWDGVTSRVLVCDRLGTPIYDQTVAGTWQLDQNTRLADLDMDQRPDIVRVGFGEADVLRNTSTDPQALSFAPGPTTFLSPQFTPTASWVLDVNGDGRSDIVSRFDGGVAVWLGTGGGQFDPSGTTYEFDTADGPLPEFASYQLSFGDFNGDGLADAILTQGQAAHLFTNRGDAFVEAPVPALQDIPWPFAFPLIADLSGGGNEEAVFVSDTEAMALELTSPSTGLLRSADDGKGTVVRFGYGRIAATAGVRRRFTALTGLTIESSGYDTVSYAYGYGAPVLHTLGKYLVGFAGVDERAPFLTQHLALFNDDDVSGVRGLSEDTDDRTAGIVRFTDRTYDDVRHRGVRWLRPATVETGYRSADGSVRLSTTTRHALYERDFCPTVVTTSAPDGTLTRTTTLTSVAAIPDDLHCLAGGEMMLGAHSDPARDFNYLSSIARDDLGQITQVTQIAPAGATLVLQELTYTADHRAASLGAPGHGTAQVTYDGLGKLASVTDQAGVVTQVGDVDPVSEAMRSLVTARPDAPVTGFFRYDGRERLHTHWDDASGASEARPLVSYLYRDPTASAPGRVDTQTLADAVTGTTRQTLDLLAADGEAMVSGTWLGDHFALGRTSIASRAALTHRTAFAGTMTADAVAAMTSADLRALGASLVETTDAGFGHQVQATTTQQDGVVGTQTTELALTATELITRVHDPAGFTAESAVDAAGRLVRKTDENGAVHRYAYDALGRLVRIDTPDGAHTLAFDRFGRPGRVARDGVGAIVYRYDPATGVPTGKQRLDVAGAVIDASATDHDAVGRPTRVTRTAPGEDDSVLQFDYDGELDGTTAPGQLGRTTRVRGDGWERTQLYDALGRVDHEDIVLTGWRELVRDRAYRADGSIASDTLTITDPAEAVRFTSTQDSELDGLGRVSALKVNGNVLYTLSYDPEGRLAHADFATGEVITFDYDPVTHQRRGHTVTGAAASGGVRWDRDPRGQIADEIFSQGTTRTRRDYGYDGRGALTTATTGGDIASYGYTASGLPDTIHDAVSARGVHRSAGQLTVDGNDYTWDAAGRVVGDGAWTFHYGAGGQLRSASRSGRQIDFVYDDTDQRLLKRVDGAPVRGNVAGGVVTEDHFVELVTIGGVVVGVLDNARFTALLTDPRGTPFVGPDGTPGLASPYGVRTAHLSLAEVIDYAQLGWDPDLDVIRMGVRDYDPKLSQFLTPDPLYLEDLEKCQTSPLQCGLYGYAAGNPIRFVDPTGTQVAWNGSGQGQSPFDALFEFSAGAFVTNMQDPKNYEGAVIGVAVVATAGVSLTVLPEVCFVGEGLEASPFAIFGNSALSGSAGVEATAATSTAATATSTALTVPAATTLAPAAAALPTATVAGGGTLGGALVPVAQAGGVGAGAAMFNALTDSEISTAVSAPPSSCVMVQAPAPTGARYNISGGMMVNEHTVQSTSSAASAQGNAATRIRVHTADPTAPAGSNSATGNTVTITQGSGARRYIPGKGWVQTSTATSAEMNDSHIPIHR
ncbi:MAG TPA: FG-GAP-like repeat-containing protein [Kofleriaceae bacterium]|nr:FG-GAP-like repeat-containing protein [Kofleriaceae bacterium]